MSLESTQKVMQLLTQDWSMSLQEKDGRLEAIEYRRMPDGVIDWSVGIIDGRVTLVLAIQEGSKPTAVLVGLGSLYPADWRLGVLMFGIAMKEWRT